MTRRALSAVLPVCAILTLSGPAYAAKRSAKQDTTAAAVEKVLRDEGANPIDRRGRLAEILQRDRNHEHGFGCALANWQSGFVRAGKEWRSYDSEEKSPADTDRLRSYREQRSQAPQTGEGQLGLADWCRKNDFADQEQAHLFAALGCAPELITPERLTRLGYRQFAGQWLSPDQWRDWQILNALAEESLERWEPRLYHAVEQLSEPGRRRDIFFDRLAKTLDASAVPAIEYLLAGESQESALFAIEILKRLDGYEASQALAKQGAFSKWRPVCKAANEALKSRKFEDFVPPLITLLATPVKVEFKLVDAGLRPGINEATGTLFHSLILARETEDQFQVATLRTVNTMTTDYLPQDVTGIRTARKSDGVFFNPDVFYSNPRNVMVMNLLARGRSDAERTMRDQVHFQERTIDEYNERTTALNGRIGAVLAAISGLPATSDPKPWWEWWAQYTDTERPGGKLLVSVSETKSVGSSVPRRLYVGPMSCFAAGTPVWTETGLAAIETIEVGDRVLSKDVETGALAYLPVVQATVRPPKELCSLEIGDETFVCTGGHRFWVSGDGWVKGRDLKPRMLIHTVTGNLPVRSVETSRSAETHNLIVPDFHTYFVGRAGLLAQDLLMTRPTNKVVPGLAALRK